MSRGWEGGSTRAWRKTRQAVLDRDQHRCQLQLDGCTTRATCVHHLRGKVMGDDPAWLVASCQACNLRIGDPNSGTTDPRPRPSTLL